LKIEVETRLKTMQKSAEVKLDKYFAEINKIAGGGKEARSVVESQTLSVTDNHESFLIYIDRFNQGFAKMFNSHIQALGGIKDKKGKILVNTELLRKEYNQFVNFVNNFTTSLTIPSRQQSHKDYNVIGQRAFIIYTHLEKIARDIELQQNKEANSKQVADAKIHAETFRKAYMTAIAVSRAPIGLLKGADSIADMEAAVDHFTNTTNQTQWELIKNKTVNVLAGTGTQTLEIVRKQPKATTEAEKEIGKLMGQAWSNGGVSDRKLKNFLNKTEFTKLKGSKVLEDEIVKQVTDLALGKKPKPYKSRTSKQKKQAGKSAVVKGSAKLKQLKKKAKSSKLAALGASVNRISEKGAEQSVRELLKIQRLINKRLPAEVRRNMGKPALTNRTGTFSNSVFLKYLRPSAGGISGDYTYMRTGGGVSKNRGGVYETFENTGSKSWSTGYNPKDLIVKSIRNLALQYTDKKFTYLRRT
jgi:hypothetical protein|tara:strand:- start:1239 stop:2654 length:1416 start_codon:yes stop_codon:yes gene_type:complete